MSPQIRLHFRLLVPEPRAVTLRPHHLGRASSIRAGRFHDLQRIWQHVELGRSQILVVAVLDAHVKIRVPGLTGKIHLLFLLPLLLLWLSCELVLALTRLCERRDDIKRGLDRLIWVGVSRS